MTFPAPRPYTMPASHESLFDSPWVSMQVAHVQTADGDEDYIYSHESRCHGVVIATLPYRLPRFGGIEILLHESANPAWLARTSKGDVILDSLTGGWEGGDTREDAKRELLEEGGYDVSVSELQFLGACFAGKSTDTVNYLYAVNLSGREPTGVPSGDGSVLEMMERPVWVPINAVDESPDPLVSVMTFRLFTRFLYA